MKVPLSWLKEFVELTESAAEIAGRLTLSGAEAEVESFLDGDLNHIVVGKVVELAPIENTDHLKRALVDTGGEKLQVVCGAPNVAEGQKVVLAKIGAILHGGFEIKRAKLRGVESFGMICSEAELGISDDHSGIMILDEDANPGEDAIRYLGLDDSILNLDLTPNRADLLSITGVARDVACLTGQKIKRPRFDLKESMEKASDYIKVSIEDTDACPRYAARIIKGVKIGPSPWWIRRKLLMCGIRPISNIVDITNLVMLEMGHPLHAFDYDLFGSKEILVRRARENEKFVTLDGKEHELTPDVLLITDSKKAVAAGGVMGGLESEVKDNTSTILLESAYFNPTTIRRSKNILAINTESSARFERGADPNIVGDAINRAASLMQEYAGGEILSGIVDYYPRKIQPRKIMLRPSRANSLLGTNISKERMINILRGIEFDVLDKEILEVTVPTFAVDINREVDLIEEIIRIEGYDKVQDSIQNKGPLFTPHHPDDKFCEAIRSSMTALGYDEMYSPGMADSRLLAVVSGNEPQLKILNPIADDLSVMQNSLIYSLLKAVSHNIAHRNVDLSLFDIGRVYLPGDPPYEEEKVGIVLTGKSPDLWYRKGNPYGFHDIKGAIDSMLSFCRIPGAEYIPSGYISFADSCCFELRINGKKIGRVGMIKEEMAKRFDIKQNVFAAVLDFKTLMGEIEPEPVYQALPRFPAAPRDLAVIVDEAVEVGLLMAEIKNIAGPLLENVTLFDLFTGKQVGEGKKSIAFSMTYRSTERSLESEEVNKIHGKIVSGLTEKFNAQIREA